MTNRVCVFIDVGNQFYCINKRWPGRKLNYERYMAKCKSFGQVNRAFAYGTQVDDSAIKFITALHHFGFEPHYKQIEKNTWYSWDVGMSLDIVRLHQKSDVIIIGNSNRSIAPLVNWIKERGIRIIIMACGINKDVKEACDQWIEVTEDMLEDEVNEGENTTVANQEITEAA